MISGLPRRAATRVPGVLGADQGDAEGALDLLEGGAHAVHQVARFGMEEPDQLHQRLGVGLGPELDPLSFEVGAHRGVILDDAVVDQGEAAGRVDMGVGVAVGGGPVGGPAGMGDADRAGDRLAVEPGFEVGDAPGGLPEAQRPPNRGRIPRPSRNRGTRAGATR